MVILLYITEIANTTIFIVNLQFTCIVLLKKLEIVSYKYINGCITLFRCISYFKFSFLTIHLDINSKHLAKSRS